MYRRRNWIRRISATFLPILLLLMTPTLGIWLSVVREGQVDRLISAVLSNESARTEISRELANSIISSLDDQTQTAVTGERQNLIDAISTRLAKPEVQQKFVSVATTIFDAIASGDIKVSVDPSPIADEFVLAINTLSGIEKVSRANLGEIEPISIGTSEEPLPNLNPMLTALRYVALITLLLSILTSLLIVRTSQTPFRGISIPLLVIGGFWVLIPAIGLNLLKGQFDPGIQSEAVPIIAGEITSGIRALATIMAVLGVACLVTHQILKRNGNLAQVVSL